MFKVWTERLDWVVVILEDSSQWWLMESDSKYFKDTLHCVLIVNKTTVFVLMSGSIHYHRKEVRVFTINSFIPNPLWVTLLMHTELWGRDWHPLSTDYSVCTLSYRTVWLWWNGKRSYTSRATQIKQLQGGFGTLKRQKKRAREDCTKQLELRPLGDKHNSEFN